MAETKSHPMSAGKELQARIRMLTKGLINGDRFMSYDYFAECVTLAVLESAQQAVESLSSGDSDVNDFEHGKEVGYDKSAAAIQRLAEEVKHG